MDMDGWITDVVLFNMFYLFPLTSSMRSYLALHTSH